jgi:hydroxyacylglutathione hydrolase
MLKIIRLHAFNDNYIWVIRNQTVAFVVDPGDCDPVINYLNDENLRLQGILLTHWHNDHQGGVEVLKATYPEAQVYGSTKQLKGPSNPVRENDRVDVLGAEFRVLEVPGHTLDHVAFFSHSCFFDFPVAFTGDTLFAAGCGRLFEGTPNDMFVSLGKLNQLPEDTKIFCAHEYTEANLKFAVTAEPDNKAMSDRLERVKIQRLGSEPTIPTDLALERLTNPFLRASSVEQLAARRKAKDQV